VTSAPGPAAVVLVDTSVWIDHLRSGNAVLAALLEADRVAAHALVIEEIALGTLARRNDVIGGLERLVRLPDASHREVLHLVTTFPLWGRGLSAVDTHLLASTLITPGARLWTRDQRLHTAAAERGVAYTP